MAEMPLACIVPISTFPRAPLLNHEVRNINGLIIPAESEIKDIPFLLLLPNRWWSDLASPKH